MGGNLRLIGVIGLMTGAAFVLAFVVLSAFRDVFFAGALRAAPFFAFALIAFATCTLAFLLIAVAERKRTLFVVFADMPAFLLMNAFTAVSWLAYFQSLRFIEPAIVNVLFAGVGPLTIMAMTAVGWRIVEEGAMTPGEIACQVAMAFCLVALAAAAVAGFSAGEGGKVALIGCAFATGAGITITVAQLYAKRLHDDGASAAAVVATRFLGVLAAAAIALIFAPEAREAVFMPATWLAHAPMAFVLMAVPIYLNQIGVKRASPLTVRVIMALAPVFVIALQSMVGGMGLSGYSLAGVAAYCAIAIAATVLRALSARAATAPAPASTP